MFGYVVLYVLILVCIYEHAAVVRCTVRDWAIRLARIACFEFRVLSVVGWLVVARGK